MIIKELYIDSFRALRNLKLPLGKKITVIAGQNGTMKTTILGMIGQPFSLRNNNAPLRSARTIEGFTFQSKFSDKFKLAYPTYDKPGEHKWSLTFYNTDVYPRNNIEIKSIRRSEPKRNIDELRFWPTIGREKGMGYAQYPVRFLSLKRLSPIGEEKAIAKRPIELTAEEKTFYKNYHNKILLLEDEIQESEYLYSSNKQTLGAKTLKYDSLTNSAGQDNIGQILLSILSFARLKNNYPEDYKGGILLIDEIDATLHPAAQIELVKALIKFSRSYNLQIIFTTHSFSIMNYISSYDRRNDDLKILYLVKEGDTISCHIDPDIKAIEANLNVTAINLPDAYVTIYCEDDEARLFLKAILPIHDQLKINIAKENMGSNNLISLAERNISEFTQNIIVLDGDVNSQLPENFIKLPGSSRPENLIYDYLKNIPADNHEIWDSFGTGNGYSKQFCFRGYNTGLNDRNEAKEWFKNQLPYWGENLDRIMIPWKKENQELVEQFQQEFIRIYNRLAPLKGLPQI